jgi:SAM-dependent methyltransferase
VSITRRRFQLSLLKGGFTQGDAENLPFSDGAFDFVYSHGVLHHTPDTAQTIREIYRVLSPGGRAVVMLYYRNSFNYQINVKVLRRMRILVLKSKVGIKLAGKLWNEPLKDLQRHAELVRKDPEYSSMRNMLNRNTDGPDNPLSQVFSKVEARHMFRQFANLRMEVMFWNPRWVPGIGKLLPRWAECQLASLYGWHLWIFAQKRGLEFAQASEIPRPTSCRVKVHVRSEASVA